MTDIKHTVNALKMMIKKEIIDNYFAERTYLEEDLELLSAKEAACEAEFKRVLPIFAAFYHLLDAHAALPEVMHCLGLDKPPFYQECKQLQPALREEVLNNIKPHGWTARSRLKNQVLDLYDRLQKTALQLREKQKQVATHTQLYNEDVEKFNLNYDFNLIAAQIEALEGEASTLESGLSAADREAMSARMILHKKKLKACFLVTSPDLPSVQTIKKKLGRVIDKHL
ncbi:hypothetical protein [Desulfobacca acetoxidans]